MRRIVNTNVTHYRGIIVLLAIICAASSAASGVEYIRKALPDHENAWTFWADTLKQLGRPVDENLPETFQSARDFDEAMPTGDAGRKLQDWIESRQAYLDTLSRGIALGKLQFPLLSPDSFETIELFRFRDAAFIKIVKARFLMRDGHYADAAKEVLEIHRMGQMISSGDGPLIHYLVGAAVQSVGLNGIRQMAVSEVTPEDVLVDLLNKLPASQSEDPSLAQTYRVEFSYFTVPSLKIEERLLLSASNFPIAITNVFEQEATVELAVGFFERFIANTLSPWKDRDANIGTDAKALVSLEGLEGEDTDDFLWDVAMCGLSAYGPEWAEQWKKLVQMAKEQPNILGKMLVALVVPSIDRGYEISTKVRTEADLARVCLAARLFQMREGALPATLDDLVAAGILTSVPVDQFADAPLRYSREKKFVWSVGPDGTDNRADSEKDIIVDLPGQQVRRTRKVCD